MPCIYGQVLVICLRHTGDVDESCGRVYDLHDHAVPVVVVGSRWIFVIFHPVEDIAPFCASRTIGCPFGFGRIG